MASTEKDTIYIDVDDEITTIIDKLRASDGRIIALVLPKRASVFQSVVNMKLLKRAADVAKKRVVLITTEANLMPLAGTVGLYVAATAQSKPEIPQIAIPASDDVGEAEDEASYTLDNAAERPVGELAQQQSGHVVGAAADDAALVDLDMEQAEDEPDEKPARDHALAVPNFHRFRLGLFLAGLGLIGLVGVLYVCIAVLPKGVIAITTDTSQLNVSTDLTLDPAVTALDTTNNVVPAKSEQQAKTTFQQTDATGQKNNGDTATGTVAMTAQACAPHLGTPDSVPAGTGVSTNGLTFITSQTASFSFDHFNGGSCAVYKSGNVAMTAQNAGAKYNISGATFSVAGRNDITAATGSASGGTDDVVKVVAQADIDGAKQKLATQDTDAIKGALQQTLTSEGLYPLTTTFNIGTPTVTTSANVGDQADNVTVTQAVTYTMLGAQKQDLDALIAAKLAGQINATEQKILDDGLASATITVTDNSKPAEKLSLETKATVGPSIDASQIKQQAKGKRIGDVKTMINALPGVTKVEVNLSPFWVSTVPTDPAKVTVTINKAS